MLAAFWAGATLIGFFGVTLSALRIAGGLRGRVAGLAAPVGTPGTTRTASRRRPLRPATADDVAFFPLTIPFTAGPGTIAVAIALSAGAPSGALDRLPFFAGGTLAAVAVAMAVGLATRRRIAWWRFSAQRVRGW